MRLATFSIDRRFRGPPDSGNGGYVVGMVARFAPAPVSVRLHLPPPLGVPLELRAPDGERLELAHGEQLVASATPAEVEFELPAPPAYEAAMNASRGFAGFRSHIFPQCFVCGPARAAGDGLRLFAGPLDGTALYAAPWQPDASLAGTHGRLRPEFMAAALDCPGYFAVAPGNEPMLLGSMALTIDRPVAVGERCVIAAWGLGNSGRKRRAATALFGADGSCAARAIATWIELRVDTAAATGVAS